MKTPARLTLFALASLAGFNGSLPALLAQSTAFTYQGQLLVSGAPANDAYNMTFTLFTQQTGGSQIGGAYSFSKVPVNNGWFSVQLDFGANAFTGADRWLEVSVLGPPYTANYTVLSPRQQLLPVPYSLYSATAGSALQANTLATSAVSQSQLNTTAAPVAGQVLSFDGTGLTWTTLSGGGGSGWSLTGNAGTVPSTDFLGTTDDQPLTLRAKGEPGFQLQFASSGGVIGGSGSASSMNILAGWWGNTISSGVLGATVSGGGEGGIVGFRSYSYPNTVTGHCGTVGGGYGNTAGNLAVVPGGAMNSATGAYSFAAGHEAQASSDGSFVWGSGSSSPLLDNGANTFNVYSSGGMHITSPWGIGLEANDDPIITRGWDPFASTAGNKAGHGRWGLFMEYTALVNGIAGPDVGYRQYEVAGYNVDGTRTPYLTVGNNGVTTVKVLTITGGADLAEPFKVGSHGIRKGSVVVIDDQHPGQLMLSDRPYDTRVAGIVSGANGIHPGIALHQDDLMNGDQNVALSGRVYALADAAYGPISPGDLLTTSGTPGRAMKVTDHARAQGAILGKAMSSLKQGKGLVLVLVSLQ